MSSTPRTLELLPQVRAGDGEATRELSDLLYGDLRRLAQAAIVRASGPSSIQATELVHEAFLRLSGSDGIDWQSRAHFLAVAAKAMRQVLIDRARRKGAAKRGDGDRLVTLETGLDDVASTSDPVDVLDLESSLERLQEVDPRGAEVIVCRHFGGMQVDEIGEVLGVSRHTVTRSLRAARAWLVKELNAGPAPASS
ncbi:MAG: ECF-type sigma factor [Acidobacteriota bacterium]